MGARGRKPGKPPGGPWEPSPRDLEIYACLCEGASTRAAARKFKISDTRIWEIGRLVDKWLAPQLMDSIREIKTRHASCLMHVFQEAMAAWNRSKEVAETETVKTGGKDGGEPETTRRKQWQAGNPAFLSEARAALAEIRKIWGADAPLTVHHGGDIRYSGMPREEARKQYAMSRIAQYQKLISEDTNGN